jgi:hypothetical protein
LEFDVGICFNEIKNYIFKNIKTYRASSTCMQPLERKTRIEKLKSKEMVPMTVRIVSLPFLTQVSDSYTYIKFQNLFLEMSDRNKNTKKTRMIESLRLMTFMINIEKKSSAILTPSGLSARRTSISLRTSRTVFVELRNSNLKR